MNDDGTLSEAACLYIGKDRFEVRKEIASDLEKEGFKWGEDYRMVLHVHDEIQFVVLKNKIEKFKEIANRLFDKTQQYFNFKCPLAGEIKVGYNWSGTH